MAVFIRSSYGRLGNVALRFEFLNLGQYSNAQ